MKTAVNEMMPKGFGNRPTAEQSISRQGRRLCPEVTRSKTDCPVHGGPPRTGQVLGIPTRPVRTGEKTSRFHEKSAN